MEPVLTEYQTLIRRGIDLSKEVGRAAKNYQFAFVGMTVEEQVAILPAVVCLKEMGVSLHLCLKHFLTCLNGMVPVEGEGCARSVRQTTEPRWGDIAWNSLPAPVAALAEQVFTFEAEVKGGQGAH